MEKSIQERAVELGVPVIQPIERRPDFPLHTQSQSDFYKQIQVVEAICGGCGKELMRGQMRQQCGRGDCPFGVLINYNRIL